MYVAFEIKNYSTYSESFKDNFLRYCVQKYTKGNIQSD